MESRKFNWIVITSDGPANALHKGTNTFNPSMRLAESISFTSSLVALTAVIPSDPSCEIPAAIFYSVAQSGGDLSCREFFLFQGAGCSVVFKIDSRHVLTVLHTFAGWADGAVPQRGLLLDAGGNLFGTTFSCGTSDNGTVFEIAEDGTYRVIHRFTQADGQNPNEGLVLDPAGNLYGTTQLGGNQSLGTVFELNPNGSLKLLHDFQGLEDGAVPLAGLSDQAGHLYAFTKPQLRTS